MFNYLLRFRQVLLLLIGITFHTFPLHVLSAFADSTTLTLSAEQTGDAAVPYGAVRFRITLKNVGENDIGPIGRIEGGVSCIRIEHPDTKFSMALNLREEGRFEHGTLIDSSEVWHDDTALKLKPDESSAVTIADAAVWDPSDINGGGPRNASPLFAKPGKYIVHWKFRSGDVVILTRCVMTIREPSLEESKVIRELEAQPDLVSDILSTICIPGPKVIPTLRKLADQKPETVFNDYARFALARARLGGVGCRLRLQRSLNELAKSPFSGYESCDSENRKWLMKMLKNQEAAEQVSRKLLDWNAGSIGAASGWLDEINRFAAARGGTDQEIENAVNRFARFQIITPEDITAAVIDLAKIKSPNFPYLPNALSLQLKAIADRPQAERDAIRVRMIEECPDAQVTLDALGRAMGKDKERWESFRILERRTPK